MKRIEKGDELYEAVKNGLASSIYGMRFKIDLCIEESEVPSCNECKFHNECRKLKNLETATRNYEKTHGSKVPTQVVPVVNIDYSKKENQIGCGYCRHEKSCVKRDPKVNKAKLGCKDFKHFEDK